MTETRTLCPWCREKVDPDVPTVAYAVELVPTPVMTDPKAVAEGLGGYFHEHCSRNIERLGYRRKPKP